MVVAFREVRGCPALGLRVQKLSTSLQEEWQVTLGKFYATKTPANPAYNHAEAPKLYVDVT